MSNRQVTYELRLNSNVRESLMQTEAAAVSLDSKMITLNNTLGAVAAAMSVRKIIGIGEDMLQTAADYENAVLRIKFASDNLVQGANNIAFIRKEAEKFRIPIQSATDDYGKFLAMVQGSGMSIGTVQKLHDELLTISKIKHLDPGQLSAGVMNLGKMLEAGALDARHLRPLEMQLSGIGKFIADELGVSVHELAKLRNKGKLTDIDPMVLLRAVEKQSSSLESHLPEAVESLQSQINQAQNNWMLFKNEIGKSPEIKEMLQMVGDLTRWLYANSAAVMDAARAVGTLLKLYIEWRLALIAIQGPATIIGLITNEYRRATGTMALYTTGTTAATAATIQSTEANIVETTSVNTRIAALEREFAFRAQFHNEKTIMAEQEAALAAIVGNAWKLTNTQMIAQATAVGAAWQAANHRIGVTAMAGAMYGKAAGTEIGAAFVAGANEAKAAWTSAIAQTEAMMAGMVTQAGPLMGIRGMGGTLRDSANGAHGFGKSFMGFATGAAIAVGIAWIASEAVEAMGWFGKRSDGGKDKSIGDVMGTSSWSHSTVEGIVNYYGADFFMKHGQKAAERFRKDEQFEKAELYESAIKVIKDYKAISKNPRFDRNGDPLSVDDYIKRLVPEGTIKPYQPGITFDAFGVPTVEKVGQYVMNRNKLGPGSDSMDKDFSKDLDLKHLLGKDKDKSSKIRGNSVTTINIDIGELNGMKNPTFQIRNARDMDEAKRNLGNDMVNILSSAINDSQIVGKHN